MPNFKSRDDSAAQSETTQTPEPKGNDILGNDGRENANAPEGTGPQIGIEDTESAPSSPVAFRNMDIVIAVDVSRSTKREVPVHEIMAGQILCNKSASTTTIPWESQVDPSMAAQNVFRLRTDRGGTRPSALASTLSSVNALKACSAWLLFTDGEIIDREIREFSAGICKNGLHGTACVVIFGRKTRKPLECNISVGVSLFGLVPNCLFLFHDIETSKGSILQSKGVFNQLLPDGYKNPSLNGSIHW